jgi:hypothetical protein
METDTYVHVESERGKVSMGQTLPAWGYTETDPHELIKHWQKDDGIYLTSRFVPWRLIDSVSWEYHWRPRD